MSEPPNSFENSRMLRLKDGWPSLPPLGALCALVFHRTVFFLFLTHLCGGQSQMVSPSHPIVATVGDDIVLPCQLEPAVDAADLTVDWSRPDLYPRFVHVWRDGVELKTQKHPSYVGRTSLFINKLKHGDISLKLHKVKLSDEGTYRCFIPTLNRESSIQLIVGAVSSLIISLMRTENDEDISGVVLQCKSKGWHPEPEVFWLDNEGNLLSGGPTEKVKGPDGLYTVSSRVTVEKKHSNTFICRVQQKNINQTRETHIHVPDDLADAPCSLAAHIAISLTVVFIVILAAVFLGWKWRQKQTSNNLTTSSDNTELALLNEEKREKADSTTNEDSDEKTAKLNGQLKEAEEKCKILTDLKKDVENQMHELILQLVEIQTDESKHLLEDNSEHSKGKQNEAECPDTKTNLDTVKTDLKKKLQETDAILKFLFCRVTEETEKKNALNNLKEHINKQPEEIKKQTDDNSDKLINDTDPTIHERPASYGQVGLISEDVQNQCSKRTQDTQDSHHVHVNM